MNLSLSLSLRDWTPICWGHAIDRSALSGARTLEELSRGRLAARAHAPLTRGHGRPPALYRAHTARGRRLRTRSREVPRARRAGAGFFQRVVAPAGQPAGGLRFRNAANRTAVRARLAGVGDRSRRHHTPVSICRTFTPTAGRRSRSNGPSRTRVASSTSASTICRLLPRANGSRASTRSRRARAASRSAICSQS